MDWFKLHLSFLRSPQFIGCEPIDRATWIALMAHCADQENGGLIRNCRDWGNRRWMQTAGVTEDEVHRECDLWQWEGCNLRVSGFDKDSEAKVKRNRTLARAAGKKSGENRRKGSASNGLQHEPSVERTVERTVERSVEQRRGEERRAEQSRGEGDPTETEDLFAATETDNGQPAPTPKITGADLLPFVRFKREDRADAIAALDVEVQTFGGQHLEERLRLQLKNGDKPWFDTVHAMMLEDPANDPMNWPTASEIIAQLDAEGSDD